MQTTKILFLFSVIGFFLLPQSAKAQTSENSAVVPLGGNTWKSNNEKSGGQVSQEGIVNWTSEKDSFTTYIRVAAKGSFRLYVNAKVPEGNSEVQVSALGKKKNIKIKGSSLTAYDAGTWTVKDTGYIAIHFIGKKKSGSVFADIASLELKGSAINGQTAFVKNNEGNFYYWGRRGPSVHLSYALPDNKDIEWFYNEITVPQGEDVIGSYYMANGFAEGYFGIQVNSPTERRILFSVWSPFHTDDPKQIPEDQKIIMLKKGEGVQTGEFGNEGSGGQSFMRYPWKAGTTYGFLLRGVPDGEAHTIYTAYFFAPEKGSWMLIASFRRPKTATYLKRLHSFLENFIPGQGNISRKVLFTNQWVRDTGGLWHPINKARFTGDNTAQKKYRMDYAGGVSGNAFFLQNCGFFSQYTPLNTWWERPAQQQLPTIPFESLP